MILATSGTCDDATRRFHALGVSAGDQQDWIPLGKDANT